MIRHQHQIKNHITPANSQSRRLHHFPKSSLFNSHTFITKYRIYDNTLSQILKKMRMNFDEKKEETATRPSPNNMANPDTYPTPL